MADEKQTLPIQARTSSIHLLLMGAALVIAAVLVWQLSHLLLLIFGAVLVAVLLRALSGLIRDHTPLGDKSALALAGLIVFLALAAFAVFLGAQVQAQLRELIGQLPDLLNRIGDRFGVEDAEAWLRERAGDVADDGSLFSDLAGYSTFIVGILGEVVLVVIAGIYLAVAPGLYRGGVLMLFPARPRQQAADALDAVGGALKLWLVGQLAAMVLVGLVTGLGLWLLGIPSALALGLIAGLLEFVPYVGPFLSAVPAIALGLAEGPTTALWVAGLYLAVQQMEGNLITPLVQQRTVSLPPALTIFAIVAFGILFGPLGILFATPLAVVAFVLVKKLWVRDTLQEKTAIPGEE